jgi:hypothetical protein
MGTANILFNGEVPNPMDRISPENKVKMMQRAKILRLKHPTWKPEKLMRKVAEEFSVKLDMSDGKKLSDILKQIASESSSGKPISIKRG